MTVFTVTNLNDVGPGSLRAAITAANVDQSGTPAVINFSVAGTITLGSALPAISHDVKIDATTAPTYTSGGPPAVEINCNGNAGLVFAAGSDGSNLLGMSVGNASGNGVTLNASFITLNNNYIGLSLTGTAIGNGGDGVFVSAASSNNVIGLNASGASGVVANVISGNAGNGISFHGSSGNTVAANRIGTDATGTTAIANGGNGIWVTAGSYGNTIGGTDFFDTATGQANDPTGDGGTGTPVFIVPPLGNLVSGNGQNGILIDAGSQNNVLNGNFVGTTADGNSALGNTADGVLISGADNNSLIGCTRVEKPFVYYNVISGNGANGLEVKNSNNVTVQANFFGVGANNTSLVANQADGILVDGSSQNTLVGGPFPLGNVAAGNDQNGIGVSDTASGFLTYNTFGGVLAFKGAAPNLGDGILVTSTGGNNTIRFNVFSGNDKNGVEISGNASGVTAFLNSLGLSTGGNTAIPNGADGVLIGGTAHDNAIGLAATSPPMINAISGNAGYGVELTDQSYNNQVLNSFIGTDVSGNAAIPNALGGMLVGGASHNDTVGGANGTPSAPTADLVSGNTGNGITLGTATSFIQVIGNSIGFDHSGNPVLPNSGAPIVNNGTSNTIQDNAIACFAAGTRIATEHGEVAVQALQIGQTVRTMVRGQMAPVIWIGRRQVDCRRHPDPRKVQPVRIAAGAFGAGLPARTLYLSPDHAVFVDDVLIPVKHLINHRTIAQIAVAHVTYYHIELPRHDVLLAEGLPSESYLDTGGWNNFANGAGSVRLFADFAAGTNDMAADWEARGCAPLVVGGTKIEGVRRRLHAKQSAHVRRSVGWRRQVSRA